LGGSPSGRAQRVLRLAAGKEPGYPDDVTDRRAKLLVAPGWIQAEMGGSDASYTVEECIPLVADMLEKNHGKAGLRYVDRFDTTLPW
jgi:hypothetical protein